MYKLNKSNMKKAEPFFEGWQETMIWSCLQGCMGDCWVDDADAPKSARIIVGDFWVLAGEPNRELAGSLPPNCDPAFFIIVPDSEAWEPVIEEEYGDKAEKTVRYAIKKETGIFDKDKLETYAASLPEGYSLRKIDEEVYNIARNAAWSEDLCSQFREYQDYEKHGLGFAAFHGEQMVGGASSYTYYNEGIEIEVDTQKEYRRKGLALACAAKLILECLEHDLYPSWDAHNKGSVALAEKLGYHFDKEYISYNVQLNM